MANQFKISDLGAAGEIFNKIINKHGLSDKADEILSKFIGMILKNKTEIDFINQLRRELNLDFNLATRVGYELKQQILSDPAKVKQLAQSLKNQTDERFSPEVIINDLLVGMENFELTDQNLKKRFESAIFSWLKDVRDLSELKDILTRPEKIGGIGMPEDVWNELSKLLVAQKSEIKKENIDIAGLITEYEGGSKKEEAAEPGEIKEVEIDVAAKPKAELKAQAKLTGQEVTIHHLLQEKGVPFEELTQKEAIKKNIEEIAKIGTEPQSPLVNEIEEKEEFLESKEEIEAPEEDFVETPQPVALPQMPKAPQTQPVSQQINREINQPLITKTGSETSRPKMEDIKVFTEPRLVGPLDELVGLKIEDFRRLSKDPNEAINKIAAKLELLEDES